MRVPHELSSDLWLKILGKYEVSRKSQNFIELKNSVQSSSLNDFYVNTNKNRNLTFPTLRFFTRKLEFVSNIFSLIAIKLHPSWNHLEAALVYITN